MPPDLNTLPSSPPPSRSQRPQRISLYHENSQASPPSPHSPSVSSLQAAAMFNAGLARSSGQSSPAQERRRSSLMNNISPGDTMLPTPGELQHSNGTTSTNTRTARRSFALASTDSHHHLQPSLGELHQELENEQEAQVNRLLHMIRLQQDQIAAVHRQNHDPSSPQESSPITTGQSPQPTLPTQDSAHDQSTSTSSSAAFIPHAQHPQHFHRPQSLSRQSSSARYSATGTISQGTSPALRPQSGILGQWSEDTLLGGTRDESAFYQAETQMLTRENQMLRQRIRELERHLAESGAGAGEDLLVHNSPLSSPPVTFNSESAPPAPAEASMKVD